MNVWKVDHEQGYVRQLDPKDTRQRRVSYTLGYLTAKTFSEALAAGQAKYPGLKISVWPSILTIRERERRNASPRDGHRQKWTEVQVLKGAKVLARFDTAGQAENWIIRNERAA